MQALFILTFIFIQICYGTKTHTYISIYQRKSKLLVSKKLLNAARLNLSAKNEKLQNHLKKIDGFQNLRFEEDDQAIKFQTWGKFFLLEKNKDKEAGIKFFSNTDYSEQNKKPADNESDENGQIAIPDSKSFWIILTENGIYALSSRRNPLTQFRYNMLWNNLKATQNGYSAGLTDLGQFDEGYCAQLNSISDKMVVCFESSKIKNYFLQICEGFAKKYTIAETRFTDFEATLSSKDSATLSDYKTRGPAGQAIVHKLDPDGGPISKISYWRLLQNWSTCSQSCGGGTQTRQLICIIGLSGKQCEGSPIQTRACNEQPCLPLHPLIQDTTILPLKIKTFRVSDRPQREETCVIKEGDLEMIRDDLPGFKRPPRTPVRAILNNSTFSIFSTDNYGDILFSVQLSELQVEVDDQDVNCLYTANSRTGERKGVCAFANTHETQKDIINAWIKAVQMFKNECQATLIAKKDKPDGAPDEIVTIKKQEVDNERQDSISAAVVMDPSEQIKKSFGEIEQNVISALSREMKYENLVEKEELERQYNEQKAKRTKLAKAKESKECLDRNQRKADAALTTSIEKKGIDGLIDSLKKSIANMIVQNRVKEAGKIRVIRSLKAAESSASDDEMQELKGKMQKQLAKSYKKGDKDKCMPGQTQNIMDTYCNLNFTTDPEENTDCKDASQYCLICCDNEFGSFTSEDRVSCIKQCVDDDDEDQTKFVWQPRTEVPK